MTTGTSHTEQSNAHDGDPWGDQAALEQLIAEAGTEQDLDYLAEQEKQLDQALTKEVGRVATFVQTADQQILTPREARGVSASRDHGAYQKGRRA